MAADDSHPSPARAGWGSLEEELAYYKSQYETLEVELQEFQASSKELEAELERDVEESEKRERKLQEKAEKLGFEVEEWKTKYKQSKTEANNAQNTLRKRSPACAKASGPSRCAYETLKYKATISSARHAIKHPH